jgi:tetratricopeptide (TPR) repeat protein
MLIMKTRRSLLHTLKLALIAGSALGLVAVPAAARGDAKTVATRAQPSPDADPAALNEQGLDLYGAGDYRHALEKFIEAHALESDPNLLFNMGRCYEQLGEPDAALEKYESFLAAAGGDPAGVERARVASAALRARREQSPRSRALPGPGEPASPPSSAAAAAWVPWVTLGSGAAFVVVGATFYALGAHDHARVTELPEYDHPDVPASMTWKRAHALVRSGDTKKLVGGISLGLGGAAAAAALALLLTEDRAERPAPSLAVEPSALRGGGGLVVAGTFR